MDMVEIYDTYKDDLSLSNNIEVDYFKEAD